MSGSYGQFCSIARSLDLLGERWTLLVVRELLCGSRRFSEIQRGIPRISRTMLSARLRELTDGGVVVRDRSLDGPAYSLTRAGEELAAVVFALGTWGQRWLPRDLPRDEIDFDVLVWDMKRRVDVDALPPEPVLARLDVFDRRTSAMRYLLLRRSEVSLCAANPGFPETLNVRAPLTVLTAWWRGDLSFADARSAGLVVSGDRRWVRAFPRWFQRYAFAEIAPVGETGGQ